jgi:hypothetical protein
LRELASDLVSGGQILAMIDASRAQRNQDRFADVGVLASGEAGNGKGCVEL